MSIILVVVSDNDVVVTEKKRAGLISIGYDKDHEIVFFECVDPKAITGELPKEIQQTEEETFQAFLNEIDTTDMSADDITELRIQHKEFGERMKAMSTSGAFEPLDGAYKQKLAIRLRERFESDSKLLASQ